MTAGDAPRLADADPRYTAHPFHKENGCRREAPTRVLQHHACPTDQRAMAIRHSALSKLSSCLAYVGALH
eukprot:6214655-Pleurochrysis_carterae.AAC.1